ncbi:hypothetical protein SNEBB_002388 [Seison nebaliae]|nr:hypothetical protein SNEBB_002388 [Seison nebaliae]
MKLLILVGVILSIVSGGNCFNSVIFPRTFHQVVQANCPTNHVANVRKVISGCCNYAWFSHDNTLPSCYKQHEIEDSDEMNEFSESCNGSSCGIDISRRARYCSFVRFAMPVVSIEGECIESGQVGSSQRLQLTYYKSFSPDRALCVIVGILVICSIIFFILTILSCLFMCNYLYGIYFWNLYVKTVQQWYGEAAQKENDIEDGETKVPDYASVVNGDDKVAILK